ncbi:MAG: hypothetical protein AAF957_20635 [Planctomycetota bacterium]
MKNAIARLALLAALPLAPQAHASPFQDDPPAPKPAPGLVDLIVLDEDGEGIFKASASVVLTEAEKAEKLAESKSGSYRIDSVSTDPDGFVTIQVPSSEQRAIRVDKWREAKAVEVEIEPLKPGERREVEVTLLTKPDLDVSGTVVDATTSAPLEGVEVHLSERGYGISGARTKPLATDDTPDAVTGPDGTFTLRVRSWLNGPVTLVAPGRSPLLGFLSPRGKPRVDGEAFSMRRAATLRGAVRRAAGDLPEGATVTLEVKGYHLLQEGSRLGFMAQDALFISRVDADGNYRIDDLPSEVPLVLRVEHGRKVLLYEASARRLAAGTETVADLVIGAGNRVHGVVSESDGAPAVGIEMWLRRSSGMRAGMRAGLMDSYPKPDARTTTDVEGRFAFDDVKAGQWEVGVGASYSLNRLPKSDRFAPVSSLVELEEQDAKRDFVLHRGLYIEGSLEGPSGAAFTGSGASVFASRDGMFVHNVQVADGAFRVGPLVPGEWKLGASCWGSTDETRTFAPPPLTVGATGGDPVVLRFSKGCGLRIHAVDAKSGERVEARFSMFGTASTSRRFAGDVRVVTEVWNLEPDRYTVSLVTLDDRFGFGTYDLEAGDLLDGAEIEVRPGATVEVAYGGAWEYPAAELVVDGRAIAFDEVGTDGAASLLGPEGPVTVVLRKRRLSEDESPELVTRDVELVAGSTVRVAFD